MEGKAGWETEKGNENEEEENQGEKQNLQRTKQPICMYCFLTAHHSSFNLVKDKEYEREQQAHCSYSPRIFITCQIQIFFLINF